MEDGTEKDRHIQRASTSSKPWISAIDVPNSFGPETMALEGGLAGGFPLLAPPGSGHAIPGLQPDLYFGRANSQAAEARQLVEMDEPRISCDGDRGEVAVAQFRGAQVHLEGMDEQSAGPQTSAEYVESLGDHPRKH